MNFGSASFRGFLNRRQSSQALALVVVLVCLCGCRMLRRSPVSEDVSTARELSFRGLDAMQNENWNEAEMLFAQAIKICPTDERARNRYAEMLWRRGESAEAIRHMSEALSLSGGDPELQVRLGEMYLAQKELGQAQQQAESAIRAQNELPSAWALHGDVMARRNKLDKALASYHRALSYQAHYPQVQIAIARVYGKTGRPNRMLSTLDGLVENYPPGQVPDEALMLQGVALKTLRRYDEAVQCLAAACRRETATHEALFHLGEAQWLAGDLANANLSLSRALASKPNYGPALQLQQEIASQHGRQVAVQPSGY